MSCSCVACLPVFGGVYTLGEGCGKWLVSVHIEGSGLPVTGAFQAKHTHTRTHTCQRSQATWTDQNLLSW